MSHRAISARAFHKPLQEAGLVPPECRVMDIRIAVDGAVIVTYECFLTVDQIADLGRILARVAADHGRASSLPDPKED